MNENKTLTEDELTERYHKWLDGLYSRTPWGIAASKILQMGDPMQYQYTRRDFETQLEAQGYTIRRIRPTIDIDLFKGK